MRWPSNILDKCIVFALQDPSVPELLDALHGTDPASILTALQSLQKQAWDSEINKMQIGCSRGLRALVNLLSFQDDMVRWHAAENLSMLGLVDCLRDAMMGTCITWLTDAGIVRRSRRLSQTCEPEQYIDALISLLMTAMEEPTRVLAVWMLWTLSLDPVLRPLIAREYAVSALVLMLRPCCSPSSHFAASRLLRSLALADIPTLFARHGVVPAMLCLLGNPTSGTMVRAALCSALCNFDLSSSDETLGLIVHWGVLPAIHVLLTCHDFHCQSWAARLTRHLAASSSGATQLILMSGLVAPLLDLLASPDEHCQLTSCSTLYQLLESGPTARVLLAEAGMAPRVAHLSRSRVYAVRFVASRTLAELAIPENFGMCNSAAGHVHNQ